jgi:hypothetical protein
MWALALLAAQPLIVFVSAAAGYFVGRADGRRRFVNAAFAHFRAAHPAGRQTRT